MRDSASAQVFHYLADLDLGPQQPNERLETLGELHLIDGVSPGNDSRIVSADSLEALSCLQHRVLDLKIAAAVRFA